MLTLGLVAAGVGSAYWWEKQLPAQLQRAAEQGRLDDCLQYGEQLAALRWLGGKAPLEQGRCRRLKAQELWRRGEWADALKLTRYSHEQILDPSTNLHAGSFYLSKVLQRYAATDNPSAYALADYNAGRRNVLRWMSATNAPQARTNSAQFLAAMTYPGTRQYVEQILERRRRYESQFSGRP